MKKKFLGEIVQKKKAPDFSRLFKEFETASFKKQTEKKRKDLVNRALLNWIEKQPEPCFLLPDVLTFIKQVEEKKYLQHYNFPNFELWLNQYSDLSFEQNGKIRAKIAGKSVERSDYQGLFPIGMGKVYEGTHFVTAHKSPDLDTTVASFWGWLDAFAARVGTGLHIWNLPGGPPPSQIEIEWLFTDIFGDPVFTHLAKTRTELHVTAEDLMTQKNLLFKLPTDSITSIDHERDQTAAVVVDEEGFYLGDWRSLDVEGVRQVVILLSSCLRWFENQLQLHLISLFAEPKLVFKEISNLLKPLFNTPLESSEPALEFSDKQKKQVENFITRILKMKEGLGASFEQLGLNLSRFANIPFQGAEELFKGMKTLFDSKGALQEKRPLIFEFLKKVVKGLHDSILVIRRRLEKLDIALKTKYEVFGHHPHFVMPRSEIEEIREKIGSHLSVTVVLQDDGKNYPLGIISAADIRKNTLGTVSLRDFCNREEMTIPSYLEVISVIDHHKSSLNTFSPPLAIIADVQSSNSLVARAAFEINDRYSLGGQTTKQIEEEISNQEKKPPSFHLQQQLLKRRMAAQNRGSFFIHPQREYVEYLHFLYAILDDTDLLSKVSAIDLECVASLLNRLKSLAEEKEMEIISLDDLKRDASFLKKAARRILQNEDMYSLYKKVYAFREKEIEKNIELCATGKPSNFFSDTKEQNGCCRIGQTKIFSLNIPLLHKKEDAIRKAWLSRAIHIHSEKPEIDLHLHMISTIISADEVYQGTEAKYSHKDELWIWADLEENGIARIKSFLNAFQSSPGLKGDRLEVEFLGKNGEELSQVFKESFLDIPHKFTKDGLDMAVLRFKAGALNSRKAMVSPFLPTLN